MRSTENSPSISASGAPEILAGPLFAQAGGFAVVDQAFDSGLGEVLKDLNAAIWDGGRAA